MTQAFKVYREKSVHFDKQIASAGSRMAWTLRIDAEQLRITQQVMTLTNWNALNGTCHRM